MACGDFIERRRIAAGHRSQIGVPTLRLEGRLLGGDEYPGDRRQQGTGQTEENRPRIRADHVVDGGGVVDEGIALNLIGEFVGGVGAPSQLQRTVRVDTGRLVVGADLPLAETALVMTGCAGTCRTFLHGSESFRLREKPNRNGPVRGVKPIWRDSG